MNETYLQIIPPTAEFLSPQVILASKIAEVVANYMTIVVKDEETSVVAAVALTRVRAFLKSIDEERKAYIQPFNDFVKEINSKSKSLCEDLVKAHLHLISELRDYRQQIEKARQKEQARLDRLAQRRFERAEAQGKPTLIPEAISSIVRGAPKSVETEVSKVTFRTDWRAEIVDESLLPRQYLIPDEVGILAMIRATKGTVKIPGVRAYSVEVPVTRMK